VVLPTAVMDGVAAGLQRMCSVQLEPGVPRVVEHASQASSTVLGGVTLPTNMVFQAPSSEEDAHDSSVSSGISVLLLLTADHLSGHALNRSRLHARHVYSMLIQLAARCNDQLDALVNAVQMPLQSEHAGPSDAVVPRIPSGVHALLTITAGALHPLLLALRGCQPPPSRPKTMLIARRSFRVKSASQRRGSKTSSDGSSTAEDALPSGMSPSASSPAVVTEPVSPSPRTREWSAADTTAAIETERQLFTALLPRRLLPRILEAMLHRLSKLLTVASLSLAASPQACEDPPPVLARVRHVLVQQFASPGDDPQRQDEALVSLIQLTSGTMATIFHIVEACTLAGVHSSLPLGGSSPLAGSSRGSRTSGGGSFSAEAASGGGRFSRSRTSSAAHDASLEVGLREMILGATRQVSDSVERASVSLVTGSFRSECPKHWLRSTARAASAMAGLPTATCNAILSLCSVSSVLPHLALDSEKSVMGGPVAASLRAACTVAAARATLSSLCTEAVEELPSLSSPHLSSLTHNCKSMAAGSAGMTRSTMDALPAGGHVPNQPDSFQLALVPSPLSAAGVDEAHPLAWPFAEWLSAQRGAFKPWLQRAQVSALPKGGVAWMDPRWDLLWEGCLSAPAMGHCSDSKSNSSPFNALAFTCNALTQWMLRAPLGEADHGSSIAELVAVASERCAATATVRNASSLPWGFSSLLHDQADSPFSVRVVRASAREYPTMAAFASLVRQSLASCAILTARRAVELSPRAARHIIGNSFCQRRTLFGQSHSASGMASLLEAAAVFVLPQVPVSAVMTPATSFWRKTSDFVSEHISSLEQPSAKALLPTSIAADSIPQEFVGLQCGWPHLDMSSPLPSWASVHPACAMAALASVLRVGEEAVMTSAVDLEFPRGTLVCETSKYMRLLVDGIYLHQDDDAAVTLFASSITRLLRSARGTVRPALTEATPLHALTMVLHRLGGIHAAMCMATALGESALAVAPAAPGALLSSPARPMGGRIGSQFLAGGRRQTEADIPPAALPPAASEAVAIQHRRLGLSVTNARHFEGTTPPTPSPLDRVGIASPLGSSILRTLPQEEYFGREPSGDPSPIRKPPVGGLSFSLSQDSIGEGGGLRRSSSTLQVEGPPPGLLFGIYTDREAVLRRRAKPTSRLMLPAARAALSCLLEAWLAGGSGEEWDADVVRARVEAMLLLDNVPSPVEPSKALRRSSGVATPVFVPLDSTASGVSRHVMAGKVCEPLTGVSLEQRRCADTSDGEALEQSWVVEADRLGVKSLSAANLSPSRQERSASATPVHGRSFGAEALKKDLGYTELEYESYKASPPFLPPASSRKDSEVPASAAKRLEFDDAVPTAASTETEWSVSTQPDELLPPMPGMDETMNVQERDRVVVCKEAPVVCEPMETLFDSACDPVVGAPVLRILGLVLQTTDRHWKRALKLWARGLASARPGKREEERNPLLSPTESTQAVHTESDRSDSSSHSKSRFGSGARYRQSTDSLMSGAWSLHDMAEGSRPPSDVDPTEEGGTDTFWGCALASLPGSAKISSRQPDAVRRALWFLQCDADGKGVTPDALDAGLAGGPSSLPPAETSEGAVEYARKNTISRVIHLFVNRWQRAGRISHRAAESLRLFEQLVASATDEEGEPPSEEGEDAQTLLQEAAFQGRRGLSDQRYAFLLLRLARVSMSVAPPAVPRPWTSEISVGPQVQSLVSSLCRSSSVAVWAAASGAFPTTFPPAWLVAPAVTDDSRQGPWASSRGSALAVGLPHLEAIAAMGYGCSKGLWWDHAWHHRIESMWAIPRGEVQREAPSLTDGWTPPRMYTPIVLHGRRRMDPEAQSLVANLISSTTGLLGATSLMPPHLEALSAAASRAQQLGSTEEAGGDLRPRMGSFSDLRRLPARRTAERRLLETDFAHPTRTSIVLEMLLTAIDAGRGNPSLAGRIEAELQGAHKGDTLLSLIDNAANPSVPPLEGRSGDERTRFGIASTIALVARMSNGRGMLVEPPAGYLRAMSGVLESPAMRSVLTSAIPSPLLDEQRFLPPPLPFPQRGSRLRNPIAALQILGLLDIMTPAAQTYGIKAIYAFLTGQSRLANMNDLAAARPRAVDLLLDAMPSLAPQQQRLASRLMGVLGARGLAHYQLRSALRLVAASTLSPDSSRDRRNGDMWNVVSAIGSMVTTGWRGPRREIVCDGPDAGLRAVMRPSTAQGAALASKEYHLSVRSRIGLPLHTTRSDSPPPSPSSAAAATSARRGRGLADSPPREGLEGLRGIDDEHEDASDSDSSDEDDADLLKDVRPADASGLRPLPVAFGLSTWPASSGASISLWFRIEPPLQGDEPMRVSKSGTILARSALGGQGGAGLYQPFLLNVWDGQGRGLSLHAKPMDRHDARAANDDRLAFVPVIEVRHHKRPGVTIETPPRSSGTAPWLLSGQWHHVLLCLSQAPMRWNIARPEGNVLLFVDGVLAMQSTTIALPHFNPAAPHGPWTMDPPVPSRDEELPPPGAHTPTVGVQLSVGRAPPLAVVTGEAARHNGGGSLPQSKAVVTPGAITTLRGGLGPFALIEGSCSEKEARIIFATTAEVLLVPRREYDPPASSVSSQGQFDPAVLSIPSMQLAQVPKELLAGSAQRADRAESILQKESIPPISVMSELAGELDHGETDARRRGAPSASEAYFQGTAPTVVGQLLSGVESAAEDLKHSAQAIIVPAAHSRIGGGLQGRVMLSISPGIVQEDLFLNMGGRGDVWGGIAARSFRVPSSEVVSYLRRLSFGVDPERAAATVSSGSGAAPAASLFGFLFAKPLPADGIAAAAEVRPPTVVGSGTSVAIDVAMLSLPGTSALRAQPVRAAIDAAGGISLVFPLLALMSVNHFRGDSDLLPDRPIPLGHVAEAKTAALAAVLRSKAHIWAEAACVSAAALLRATAAAGAFRGTTSIEPVTEALNDAAALVTIPTRFAGYHFTDKGVQRSSGPPRVPLAGPVRLPDPLADTLGILEALVLAFTSSRKSAAAGASAMALFLSHRGPKLLGYMLRQVNPRLLTPAAVQAVWDLSTAAVRAVSHEVTIGAAGTHTMSSSHPEPGTFAEMGRYSALLRRFCLVDLELWARGSPATRLLAAERTLAWAHCDPLSAQRELPARRVARWLTTHVPAARSQWEALQWVTPDARETVSGSMGEANAVQCASNEASAQAARACLVSLLDLYTFEASPASPPKPVSQEEREEILTFRKQGAASLLSVLAQAACCDPPEAGAGAFPGDAPCTVSFMVASSEVLGLLLRKCSSGPLAASYVFRTLREGCSVLLTQLEAANPKCLQRNTDLGRQILGDAALLAFAKLQEAKSFAEYHPGTKLEARTARLDVEIAGLARRAPTDEASVPQNALPGAPPLVLPLESKLVIPKRTPRSERSSSHRKEFILEAGAGMPWSNPSSSLMHDLIPSSPHTLAPPPRNVQSEQGSPSGEKLSQASGVVAPPTVPKEMTLSGTFPQISRIGPLDIILAVALSPSTRNVPGLREQALQLFLVLLLSHEQARLKFPKQPPAPAPVSHTSSPLFSRPRLATTGVGGARSRAAGGAAARSLSETVQQSKPRSRASSEAAGERPPLFGVGEDGVTPGEDESADPQFAEQLFASRYHGVASRERQSSFEAWIGASVSRAGFAGAWEDLLLRATMCTDQTAALRAFLRDPLVLVRTVKLPGSATEIVRYQSSAFDGSGYLGMMMQSAEGIELSGVAPKTRSRVDITSSSRAVAPEALLLAGCREPSDDDELGDPGVISRLDSGAMTEVVLETEDGPVPVRPTRMRQASLSSSVSPSKFSVTSSTRAQAERNAQTSAVGLGARDITSVLHSLGHSLVSSANRVTGTETDTAARRSWAHHAASAFLLEMACFGCLTLDTSDPKKKPTPTSKSGLENIRDSMRAASNGSARAVSDLPDFSAESFPCSPFGGQSSGLAHHLPGAVAAFLRSNECAPGPKVASPDVSGPSPLEKLAHRITASTTQSKLFPFLPALVSPALEAATLAGPNAVRWALSCLQSVLRSSNPVSMDVPPELWPHSALLHGMAPARHGLWVVPIARAVCLSGEGRSRAAEAALDIAADIIAQVLLPCMQHFASNRQTKTAPIDAARCWSFVRGRDSSHSSLTSSEFSWDEQGVTEVALVLSALEQLRQSLPSSHHGGAQLVGELGAKALEVLLQQALGTAEMAGHLEVTSVDDLAEPPPAASERRSSQRSSVDLDQEDADGAASIGGSSTTSRRSHVSIAAHESARSPPELRTLEVDASCSLLALPLGRLAADWTGRTKCRSLPLLLEWLKFSIHTGAGAVPLHPSSTTQGWISSALDPDSPDEQARATLEALELVCSQTLEVVDRARAEPDLEFPLLAEVAAVISLCRTWVRSACDAADVLTKSITSSSVLPVSEGGRAVCAGVLLNPRFGSQMAVLTTHAQALAKAAGGGASRLEGSALTGPSAARAFSPSQARAQELRLLQREASSLCACISELGDTCSRIRAATGRRDKAALAWASTPPPFWLDVPSTRTQAWDQLGIVVQRASLAQGWRRSESIFTFKRLLVRVCQNLHEMCEKQVRRAVRWRNAADVDGYSCWKIIASAVASERGPWGSQSSSSQPEEVRWERDDWSDSLMRCFHSFWQEHPIDYHPAEVFTRNEHTRESAALREPNSATPQEFRDDADESAARKQDMLMDLVRIRFHSTRHDAPDIVQLAGLSEEQPPDEEAVGIATPSRKRSWSGDSAVHERNLELMQLTRLSSSQSVLEGSVDEPPQTPPHREVAGTEEVGPPLDVTEPAVAQPILPGNDDDDVQDTVFTPARRKKPQPKPPLQRKAVKEAQYKVIPPPRGCTWHGRATWVSKLLTFDGWFTVFRDRVEWKPDADHLKRVQREKLQQDYRSGRKAFQQYIRPLPRRIIIPNATIVTVEPRKYMFENRAIEIFVSQTAAVVECAVIGSHRASSRAKHKLPAAQQQLERRIRLESASIARPRAGGDDSSSIRRGPSRSVVSTAGESPTRERGKLPPLAEGPDASESVRDSESSDHGADQDSFYGGDSDVEELGPVVFQPHSRDHALAGDGDSDGEDSVNSADMLRLGLTHGVASRERPLDPSHYHELLHAKHPREIEPGPGGFPLLPGTLRGWLDSHSVMIALHGPVERKALFSKLRPILPHALVVSSEDEMRRSLPVLTQRWRENRLTNFEYLLWINRIAGRTTHDLGQYPVMPWVLRDFSSLELDLDSPDTFRDLTKPIGAQTEEAQSRLEDKLKAQQAALDMQLRSGVLDDAMKMITGPAYHFGTFYLNPGFILWFLFRKEPFLRMHVDLHDGKFDDPSRMFHDIQAAYESSIREAEVKELPPEMYYDPSFLRSCAGVNFGRRHNGKPVEDVTLPPWAQGDPNKFVRGMRAALESDHVSRTLPFWINLVFGVHRQGKEAVMRCNVYHPLMYSEGVDIARVRSLAPHLVAGVEAFPVQFGQVPEQVFFREHELRELTDKREMPLISRCAPLLSSASSRGICGMGPTGRPVPLEAAAGVDDDVASTRSARSRVGEHDLPGAGTVFVYPWIGIDRAVIQVADHLNEKLQALSDAWSASLRPARSMTTDRGQSSTRLARGTMDSHPTGRGDAGRDDRLSSLTDVVEAIQSAAYPVRATASDAGLADSMMIRSTPPGFVTSRSSSIPVIPSSARAVATPSPPSSVRSRGGPAMQGFDFPIHTAPITSIASIGGDSPRLVTLDQNRRIGVHAWVPPEAVSAGPMASMQSSPEPATIAWDTRLQESSRFVAVAEPLFKPAPWAAPVTGPQGPANRGEPIAQELAADLPGSMVPSTRKGPAQSGSSPQGVLESRLVAFSSDGGSVVLGGQWDGSARVVSLMGGCPTTSTVRGHSDVITAVAIATLLSPVAEVGAVGALADRSSPGEHPHHLTGALRSDNGICLAEAAAQGGATAGCVLSGSAIVRSLHHLCDLLDSSIGSRLTADAGSGTISASFSLPLLASIQRSGSRLQEFPSLAAMTAPPRADASPTAASTARATAVTQRQPSQQEVRKAIQAASGMALTPSASKTGLEGLDDTEMSVSNIGMALAKQQGKVGVDQRASSMLIGEASASARGASSTYPVVDMLVTGSADASVRVWLMHGGLVSQEPLFVLHGHDGPVTCVAANSALDVLVSGSMDGTLIIRSLRTGTYRRTVEPYETAGEVLAEWERCQRCHAQTMELRRVRLERERREKDDQSDGTASPTVSDHWTEPVVAHPPPSLDGTSLITKETDAKRAIQWVGISNAGIIVVLTGGGRKLMSFAVDGKRLSLQELQLHAAMSTAVFSEDGRFLLLAAGEPRVIHVLNAETLERVQCIGAGLTRVAMANPDRQLACPDDPVGVAPRPSRVSLNSLRSVPSDVLQFPSTISSLSFSRGEQHLLVGLSSGRLVILQYEKSVSASRVVSRVIAIFTF
jgi:hypothetical protein